MVSNQEEFLTFTRYFGSVSRLLSITSFKVPHSFLKPKHTNSPAGQGAKLSYSVCNLQHQILTFRYSCIFISILTRYSTIEFPKLNFSKTQFTIATNKETFIRRISFLFRTEKYPLFLSLQTKQKQFFPFILTIFLDGRKKEWK